MSARRKTFSGGEQEALEFIKLLANGHDGHRASLLALQAQVAMGIRIGMPVVLGITDKEFAERCYETENGGTIRLTIEQRREAVAQLTAPVEEGGEGLSNGEAAALLGVGRATVYRDRQGVPNETVAEVDGVPNETDSDEPSLGCEECGTPTLPLWVNPEDEFAGRLLLCGRCAERRDSPPAQPTPQLERDDEEEDEEAARHHELSTRALHVWKTLLELSACREIPLEDVIAGLPVDRLEHVEPVANVLIAWLSELTNGTRDRQSQQPVGLASERIKRGRENGWRNPA